MIAPGTRIIVDEVPLAWIVVTEHQPRYPDRVLHYYRLLTDPAYAGHFAGLVSLTPHGANMAQGHPIYTLLDGHHRYCASIMAGRRTLLAAIHYAPPDDENASGRDGRHTCHDDAPQTHPVRIHRG